MELGKERFQEVIQSSCHTYSRVFQPQHCQSNNSMTIQSGLINAVFIVPSLFSGPHFTAAILFPQLQVNVTMISEQNANICRTL